MIESRDRGPHRGNSAIGRTWIAGFTQESIWTIDVVVYKK